MLQVIEDIELRGPQTGDSHHLLNIDSKTNEFPWDTEDWQIARMYFPHWKVYIGTVCREPAAFALASSDKEKDVCEIHRIAALPDAKVKGLDAMILDTIEYDAFIAGVGYLQIVLPETSCRGGDDPYDMSRWLNRMGFHCDEVKEESFEAYGNVYQEFVFRKSIHYGKFL